MLLNFLLQLIFVFLVKRMPQLHGNHVFTKGRLFATCLNKTPALQKKLSETEIK